MFLCWNRAIIINPIIWRVNNIFSSCRWWIVTLHTIPLTHNCWGEKLVSVVTGWLFHSLQNLLRAPLIKSRYSKWTQKSCTHCMDWRHNCSLGIKRYSESAKGNSVHISPKSLYSLIVLWSASDNTASIQPLCLQHLPSNFIILHSKITSCTRGKIVSWESFMKIT